MCLCDEWICACVNIRVYLHNAHIHTDQAAAVTAWHAALSHLVLQVKLGAGRYQLV